MLPRGEGVGLAAHGFDAEGDMFFERDADFFGALMTSSRLTRARTLWSFMRFFTEAGFQVQNTFRWPHIRASGNEAGEFIAGEHVFSSGVSRVTPV